MPEEKTSRGGSRMLRLQPRRWTFGPAPDAEPSTELIVEHIEETLGPVEATFHESVSDLIHVDVHHVAPNAERPFHTLVTSGMSDMPMSPPPSFPSQTHAELVALLPSDWPLSQEAFDDEGNYWPVRLLKTLARHPHEYETWVWKGHTIPNGNPIKPFAPSTKQCSSLVVLSESSPADFDVLVAPDGRSIHFFNVVPLYRGEMKFKLKAGADALLKTFADAGIGEVVDPNRVNVCPSALAKVFGRDA